jgi:outer membrane protein assembly factor BamB
MHQIARTIYVAALLLPAFLFLSGAQASDSDNWPTWRGPGGAGVARSAVPTSWSDEENIRWQTAIPGRGFSTPIVWGSRIYLTTAVPLEEAAEPEGGDSGRERGSFGRGGPRGSATVNTAFLVLCLDLNTGKEIWRKKACEAKPHEGFHRTYGSHASVSPVTDGSKVICSFGSQGIYCYDMDGELLWEHDPDVELQMRRQFGEGANPALHGGLYVQVFDHEADSFVLALDAKNGEVKWRHERDEPSTWSTPLATEHDGVWQLVIAGTNRTRSYRLPGGEELWQCGGIGVNAIPTVVRHDDLVLVMSGYREPNLQAIRLGGKGDITDADPSPIAWNSNRGTSYTASPVLHEGRYYCVQDGGKISCFDAASGKAFYLEERLPRGTDLKASPLAAGGVLYVATEAGDVHMVALGEEFKVLGTNTLSDQFFVSSPIAVQGKLLLRGQGDLFCIGESASDGD